VVGNVESINGIFAGHGIHFSGTTPIVTVTGNVIGTGTGGAAIRGTSTNATVTITGTVQGGANYGFFADNGNQINITGDIKSGGTFAAITNSWSTTSKIIHLGANRVVADGSSRMPWRASTFLMDPTAEQSHEFRVNNAGNPGVARSLYTGGTDIGNPTVGNVRNGTTYGPASEYTGTLKVPAVGNVLQGVEVDNTVGTWQPNADALDEALSSHTAAGTFGKLFNDLKRSVDQILPGTVDTAGFAPTTTEFEAGDITEATADHYTNRRIVFTAGALAGQVRNITAYSLSGGRGHFTVKALTEPPGNNDTFVIN
jgi:hypothetical protein